MKRDEWKDYVRGELANIAYEQDKLNTKEFATVFAYFCYYFCICYKDIDNQVLKTRWIVDDLCMTEYKVRKCTKELKQLNLIKRNSIGCPGGEICTEAGMIDCWDSHPPLNGFGLTEKALETNTFKNALEYTNKAFRDWTNNLDNDTEDWF